MCKTCGKYFIDLAIKDCIKDFQTVKGCNITKPLRRLATLCGASWPYEQAEKVIHELTGVCVSHDHYVKNNQSQIVDYQSRKQLGYFISSVFAEKAIDVLVCRRQKCRGMNWSLSGAENVLILRQLLLNDQWDSHWQTPLAA